MGHLTREMCLDILDSYTGAPPQVYVETGCNLGRQLAVATKLERPPGVKWFRVTYGIELDAHYAARAQVRVPGAYVIRGDTAVALPALVAKINEPLFIVLDAHFCRCDPPIAKSRFPLWDELRMLRERKYGDIIVVDDVHTFGKKRDDLRYATELEWETVTPESLSAFLGVPGRVIGDGYVMCRAQSI